MSNLYTPSFSESLAVAMTRGADSDAPHLWNNLVAYYPFLQGGGKDLFNVSGYGKHGALTTMDPATDWVTTNDPRIPWALDFDGDNDYVVVPHSDGLQCSGTAFSMGVWICPAFDLDTASNDAYICYKARTGSSNARWAWIWKLDTTTNKQQFAGFNGAGTLIFNVFGNATAWDANKWYHLALSCTAAGGLTFYRNGAADGGGSSVLPLSSDSTFAMGQNYHDNSEKYAGKISNLALWNRALLPDEIQYLHEKPLDMVRRRAMIFPAAVVAAGGTTNPFSMGAVNLLQGKLAG